MTDHRAIGERKAKQLTESVGVPVTFIEYDGTQYHFSSQWYRLYKVIGIDGTTERESSISKTWGGSNSYTYFTTVCYPCQLDNGDLEFMIENHISQDIHERFETA